ncbi:MULTISPECIES: PTS glucose transporter subunit IIA [Paenibacillus]|uniref:PTS sugar transporter subunit IIA n=1 Tax=Paenibacillus TaxID=44249 RepID=UPI002FE40234
MFAKWRKKTAESKTVEVFAPLTGRAVPLTEVPDEAFAGGHMGQGIAIVPTEGVLIAPFDGKVAHVIKTSHAVMLENEAGLQFLFHLGINTVSLKGVGFKSHVSVGDRVKAGDVLIEFELDTIRGAGFPVISPIIVTNAGETTNGLEMVTGPVTAGRDLVLKAVLKS